MKRAIFVDARADRLLPIVYVNRYRLPDPFQRRPGVSNRYVATT